ncbi:MAG: transporter substrate-binding domain-containing protein [Oscillospiraceae bacterium]|nr:transporter substrate-binding domain-containing protein [Oscillospiraceae bacterium]
MKHRIIAILLILVLLLAACGGGGEVYVPMPVLVDEVAATYEFGIAFHRGNALLRDQVWAALQELSADGTVSRIARYWFGHDPTIIPPDFEATAALEEEVRERAFIVGFDPSSAPMSFLNETGELVGFDIDLARAVADLYGWELVLLPIQWADREFELASGNIDSLWGGVTLTDAVRSRLYYIGPYKENRQVVVTMSDSGIRNLRGLRGQTMAVRSGSAAEVALSEDITLQNRLGEIDQREVLYAALVDLEQGRIDAVMMDEAAAVYFIRTGDAAAFGGRLDLIMSDEE